MLNLLRQDSMDVAKALSNNKDQSGFRIHDSWTRGIVAAYRTVYDLDDGNNMCSRTIRSIWPQRLLRSVLHSIGQDMRLLGQRGMSWLSGTA